MPAGYSGTPLIKKLGLPANGRAIFVNAPAHFGEILGELPTGLALQTRAAGMFDYIHLFAATRAELERRLLPLKAKLHYNGLLWVSWPKKTLALAGRAPMEHGGHSPPYGRHVHSAPHLDVPARFLRD